ncbi:hypothetical protein ACF3M2_13900 [Tissierella carlieri]|uniref:hypothetical protein n=1 Tax=Tissierella carlieri TaxID=689904 RepID=UPI003869B135
MLKILFALNQDLNYNLEKRILHEYEKENGYDFNFDKAISVNEIKEKVKGFDLLILNEELENENLITVKVIEEIRNISETTRIIFIANSENKDETFIEKIYNLEVYDLIFSDDIRFELITRLIKKSRSKIEALEYYKRIDISEAENEEKKRRTVIKEDKANKSPTKIITKIEKEYVYIIPDDYKKVVAILGERKSGVTTVVSLLAANYSKSKKVLVIDAAENGLFSIKSWGNENIVIDEDYKELRLNDNLLVIKPNDNNQILNLIETHKYKNDIVLIDADLTLEQNILKWIDMIIHVSTLDIMDINKCKIYLRQAMIEGVNLSKVYLVINKHIKCKITSRNLIGLYKRQIPYLEGENGGLQINDTIIEIPFDKEFYKNSLSSQVYVDESIMSTDIINKSIDELSNFIYPIKSKKKGIGLINRLIG